ERAITELGVGEALISFLDEKGRPSVTERAFVLPPPSRIGPLTDDERARLRSASPVAGHYEAAVDRESAYELLKAHAERSRPADRPDARQERRGGARTSGTRPRSTGRRGDTIVEALAKSAARSFGTQLGRQILRGLLGSLTGSGRR